MRTLGKALTRALGHAALGWEGAGAAAVTYQSYVTALTPLLWFHLNETSGTAVDNAGSGGAALDGVWTPGTGSLGQTGLLGASEAYDFVSAGSLITVANDASMNALAAYTVAMLIHPDNAGGAAVGRFYEWGDATNEAHWNSALTSLRTTENAATDAISQTTDGFTAATWAWLFRTYDDNGDKKIHLYKGVSGVATELTYSTQTAATGALAAKTGSLILGNRAAADRTYDGLIDEILWFSSILSGAQMNQIVSLSGA